MAPPSPGTYLRYPAPPMGGVGTSVGEEVFMVQRELANKWMYPVSVTSIYDDQTRGYVVRFQEAHGLEVDGIVGPLTWAALYELEP